MIMHCMPFLTSPHELLEWHFQRNLRDASCSLLLCCVTLLSELVFDEQWKWEIVLNIDHPYSMEIPVRYAHADLEKQRKRRWRRRKKRWRGRGWLLFALSSLGSRILVFRTVIAASWEFHFGYSLNSPSSKSVSILGTTVWKKWLSHKRATGGTLCPRARYSIIYPNTTRSLGFSII